MSRAHASLLVGVVATIEAACGGPIADQTLPRTNLDNRQLLNGKRGELRFEGPFNGLEYLPRVAIGSSITILVPRKPLIGHTSVGEVWGDFAKGAVTWPEGLAGTVAQTSSGLTLSFTCKTEGSYLLEVELSEPGGTRVSDAVDVGCITPTGLRVTGLPPSARMLVGGSVELLAASVGRTPDGVEVELWKAASVAVEPGQPVVVESQSQSQGGHFTALTLRAVKAGAAPALSSGGLSTVLDLAVGDPPGWTIALELELPPSDDPYKTIKVIAQAVAPDGGAVLGLHGCAFIARTGQAVTPLLWDSGDCRVLAYAALPGRPADWDKVSGAKEVCVAAQGKTACLDVPH